MSVHDEIQKITDAIEQQRDELKLKLHLAKADAKEEWEKIEPKWEQLKSKANDVKKEVENVSQDVVSGVKMIADDIQASYKRIKDLL